MTDTFDPEAALPAPSRATAATHPGRLRRLWRGRPGDPAWVRPALLGLLMAAALLYLIGLGRSGWANAFYSAAVQAGAHSWKAFFFGSSDAANFITVDKPPASLWIMELSARLFGVNSWSILVPQALEGVATVGVLYVTVRRWFGPVAGLLAGLALALTPVATLMFRFNNPDALLVLLLTLGAWAVTRALEKAAGFQGRAARFENVAGRALGLGKDVLDLLVDLARRLLAVRTVAGQIIGGNNEDGSPALAIAGPAEAAHAIVHDHAAGDLRGAFQVVLGARGDISENNFLGHSAAEKDQKPVPEFVPGHEVPVFGGELLGVSEGCDAPRNNGYLTHRVRIGKHHGDKRMPRFVIGYYLFFLRAHRPVSFFESTDDSVSCFLEVPHGDFLAVSPGCNEGRFIYEVGQICSDKAGGHGRDFLEIHLGA